MTTGSHSSNGSKSAPPTSLRFLLLLVGLVLLVALGAYVWVKFALPGASQMPPVVGHVTPARGSVAAMSTGAGAAADPHAADMDQINVMAEKLAAKMKKRPQDSEGWAMLARTYGVLGRHSEAIAAFEKAIALRGDDNVLRADYAGARTAAGLPPDSRGVAVAMPTARPAASAVTATAVGQTVSGTVSLAPALVNQVSPNDTVFVFARASEGSRMPLALLRKQVKDLPVQFTLDDSMGMSPASRLTQGGLVVVGARISRSGNAIPEKGDLSGQTAAVAVGAKDLKIEIKDIVMQ